jgi:hypothetical protein
MTKRREPLTYQLTLTKVAALIGWDRCGAICGVSERSVRYWSDPECETEIRMIDAERLDRAFMEAGGDHAPFHHLMALRLELAAREGEQVISLARLAGQCAKEAGEAVAALVDASSNAGDPAARRAAKAEVEQAIDALTSGLGALDRLG